MNEERERAIRGRWDSLLSGGVSVSHRALRRVDQELYDVAQSDVADLLAALDASRARIAELETTLRECEAELARLRSEARLGPQTQRCVDDKCSVVSLGTGYSVCPRCGGPLAALAPAREESGPLPTVEEVQAIYRAARSGDEAES